MSISLRCPGCGKVYEVADDRAGRQAKCKCGAAMKVPAPGPAAQGPAWEDEVVLALGPSPRTGSPPQAPESPAAPPAQQPSRPTTDAPASREPERPRAVGPRGPGKPAGPPAPWRSSLVRLIKTDVPRLLKRDPWRAAIGLAGMAYGVVAALTYSYAVSQEPSVGLFFGLTAYRMAQAGLAVAMAIGSVLILKQDKTGPAWGALAAGAYCLVPFWGLIPDLQAAVHSGQLPPLLRVAAWYAVPIALIVWSVREQTRQESE